MASELRFHTTYSAETFICLQEVLKIQLSDILFDLNEQSVGSVRSEWAYIGVGRDDGNEAGEYSPVIYRKDIWDLLSYETVWLSETPTKPSKGWDGSCIRIVTVGRWKHKRTGRVVGGMNTHLDDRGHIARYEAAKMLSSLAAREGEGGSIPVFLAGDFNSEPNQGAHEYLQTQSGLVDVQTLVKAQHRYGHHDTYTGFDGSGGGEGTKRIDFVFVSKGSRSVWEIVNYGVLESRFDDGVYSSDHRAVVVDLFLVS